MEKEKQLLMDDFRKKLFSDQKELLLEMLSKLYGTRQVVTDL